MALEETTSGSQTNFIVASPKCDKDASKSFIILVELIGGSLTQDFLSEQSLETKIEIFVNAEHDRAEHSVKCKDT